MNNKPANANEAVKMFEEQFSIVPAVSGQITDSDECCNCGEDLALELYDAFSVGYEEAIKDAKKFIQSLYED